MKRFAPLMILALIGVPLFLAVTYGSKWTTGPKYGMPVALLADRQHFADGAPLDALTTAFIRTGHQEEISGAAVGTFAAGVAWVIHQWGKQPAVMRGNRNGSGALKEAALSLSLDLGLMRWNQQDWFSRRHLLNGGVLIMGRPGSGKTSGSGMLLGKSIVADPLSSMLILCAKPEDAGMWRQIFAEHKRELLVVSPETRGRCNMLGFLGAWGADTRDIVSFLSTSAEVLGATEQSGGENAAFFENEKKRFLHHAIEILRQAGVHMSSPKIQQFINGAALSAEQLKSDVWREQFHNQCLRAAAAKKNKSEREMHDFELARDAWVKEYPVMADKTRSGILTCILGELFYFNSGIGREALSTETTCSPLDLLRGRSILVNYPPSEYGDSGALISSCWKYLAQKVILGRQFKPGDYYSIVWADEAYQFVTSLDQVYANSSRSHGGAMVYLAQSRDSFYSAMKGEKGKRFADALLSAFHHKVFHALGSPEDAEWASSLLGRRLETTFGGSMHPTQDAFDALWGNAQCHTSFNESYQPVIQSGVFQNGLRTGGHDGLVDGIVIRSGEPFSSGENFLFTTFKQ